jgi:hypothetical protein
MSSTSYILKPIIDLSYDDKYNKCIILSSKYNTIKNVSLMIKNDQYSSSYNECIKLSNEYIKKLNTNPYIRHSDR